MTLLRFDGGFIRINDQAIHSFGRPGGAVWRLVDRVTADSVRFAVINAPKRSGELASSVERRRPVYRSSTMTATAEFGATAPHTNYVRFGTPAMIHPRRAQYLALRPWPAGGYPRTVYREWVRGQEANDFLSDAVVLALAANRL